jgi:hypothetical protein
VPGLTASGRLGVVGVLAAGMVLPTLRPTAAADALWSMYCDDATATQPANCSVMSNNCTGSDEGIRLVVGRASGPNASGEMMLFVVGPKQVFSRAVLRVDEKKEHVLVSPACSFGYCMTLEPRGGLVDEMKWATSLAVRLERGAVEPIAATCPLAGLADALSQLPDAPAK